MALQAGTAVRDISPEKPLFLVGYPHIERTSTGVHDPLLASALCLRTDAGGLILVAVDTLFIEPSMARSLRSDIAGETGLPERNVFISCTHTHSAPLAAQTISLGQDPVVPPPDPEYLDLVREGITEAAVEASKYKKNAEMAWGAAHVDGVGGNRLDPDGIRDPEAGILLVRDVETHDPLCLSITYSMHPTVLHEDSRLVTSDFPGFARRYVKENLGGDPAILYHTGPAGNQSPRWHVGGQTFEEAERLGSLLGKTVLKAVRELENGVFIDDAELAADIEQVTLPKRTFPSLDQAEKNLAARIEEHDELKRRNAGHGLVRTAECAVFGAESGLFLARCQAEGRLDEMLAPYERAEVQVLRIGDAFLAGLPGELFVEYGLKIKADAGRKTFVVSLVNGHLQGYIVTKNAEGYEASNSVFLPESGDILADAALRLISRMQ